MGCYDGDTVTALWNYAQEFALNDNHFATVNGPSTPGALNLFAATPAGIEPRDLKSANGNVLVVGGTVIADPDPAFDDCSGSGPTISVTGVRTFGDLRPRNLRSDTNIWSVTTVVSLNRHSMFVPSGSASKAVAPLVGNRLRQLPHPSTSPCPDPDAEECAVARAEPSRLLLCRFASLELICGAAGTVNRQGRFPRLS
jgi:hypothetical protein